VSDEAAGLAAIEAELAGYPPYVVTTKLCEAIFEVLPGMPKMPSYDSLASCAAAVQPHTLPEVLERARELGSDPGVGRALFAARGIDTGDTGITIVTGVRTALSLFMGDRGPGAGAAQQQKTDAVLKAFGLAFIIQRLIGREPRDRLAVLKSVPAGQELLAYYAAIEIALPFTDEVAQAGGNFVAELVAERTEAISNKLPRVIGKDGFTEAQEALGHLTRTLDDLALFIQPQANQLAERVRSVLPSAFGRGDSLRDLVAAGADALPVYRYLVSRLALETRLALAKIELMPDIPMPDLSLPEPAPVAPPPPVPHALTAPSNPFAAPEPEPVAPDGPSLVPPRPSEGFPLPTEELPLERRLNGVYGLLSGDPPKWLVFTKTGVCSTALPPDHQVDWTVLLDGGHPVGTYTRDSSEVVLQWPDGDAQQHEVVVEPYALIVDGTRYARCDFSLVGARLRGRYTRRQSAETLTFHEDGSSSRGPYALGVASIIWNGSESESLYSTLEPSAETPSTLFIGGVGWDASG